MDNTTFRQDPPAEMVDRYVTSMVDYYRAYANQSYMPLDAFMQTYYPLDTGNEEEEEALEEAVEEAAEEIEEAAEAGEDAAEAGEEAASSAIEDTAEAGEEAASSAEADGEAAAPEYTNEMPEEYMEVLREQASETAKFFIILQAIADKEKLNVSNREFKTYLSTVAAGQGYTSLEDFKKENDTNEYKESMMADKVLEYLAGHAVVTEPAKEEAPAAAAEDAPAEDAEADEASEEETAEDSEGAGE
jgi:FKBP-type peptidyl-prolyl cis-trans isomerase (trigger factor)